MLASISFTFPGFGIEKISELINRIYPKAKSCILSSDTIKNSSYDNRPIVIFPQGTRTDPQDRPNFKKGVARIYDELNISCLPVVINSGEIWPKTGSLAKNKNITFSILKPIKPGLRNKEFLVSLQNTMYEVLNKTSNLSSA